jgi:CBS domain-containing protein
MEASRLAVGDVMSSPVVTVDEYAGVKEIAGLLRSRGFNAVPVISRLGGLLGVISEADIIARQDRHLRSAHWYDSRERRKGIERAAGSFARDIMTPTPTTTTASTPLNELAEIMHARHLKSLPVVDDEGYLIGMVSRRDLLGVLARSDEEIAAEVRRRLHEACVDLTAVQVAVRDGVVTLTGGVRETSDAEHLTAVAGQVDGVVRVWPWVISEELVLGGPGNR